jgi:hypothetical protein
MVDAYAVVVNTEGTACGTDTGVYDPPGGLYQVSVKFEKHGHVGITLCT